MSLYFLGNCQTNALKAIAKDVCRVPVAGASITEFWGSYTPDESEAAMDAAEVIVAMAVMNPEHRFAAAKLRARWGAKVVFHPYIYVDGLSSLEKISSKGVGIIRGGEEIMAAAQWPAKVKLIEAYERGQIDMRQTERLNYSLARMAAAEAAYDGLRVTDYIRATYREMPLLYAINHPTQRVLFHMFDQLAERLNLEVDAVKRADPVIWARRALPPAQHSLTPQDVDVHGLAYGPSSHWWAQGARLIHSLVVRDAAAKAAARKENRVDSL